MRKRGQVTIFVIVGVVLVVVIAGGFMLRKEISDAVKGKGIIEDISLSQEMRGLKDDVQYCLEDALKESLLLVASRGGYYGVPENSIRYGGYYVPLYLDGEEEIPEFNKIEENVARSIEGRMGLCGFGEAVSESDPEVVVSIGKSSAEAELFYVITLEGSSIDTFRAEVDTDFYTDYGKVLELFDDQKKIKGFLPIGELALLSEKEEYILYIDHLAEARLYFLTFNQTLLNSNPLAFSFGIRH